MEAAREVEECWKKQRAQRRSILGHISSAPEIQMNRVLKLWLPVRNDVPRLYLRRVKERERVSTWILAGRNLIKKEAGPLSALPAMRAAYFKSNSKLPAAGSRGIVKGVAMVPFE